METFRKFVDKYIAEENEKFTKKEFVWAVIVSIVCSIALVWCSTFDIKL